jgi:hypothetical protein
MNPDVAPFEKRGMGLPKFFDRLNQIRYPEIRLVAFAFKTGQVQYAIDVVRKTADIVVPPHDPVLLKRFPDGVVVAD